jgi:hypothetical protein
MSVVVLDELPPEPKPEEASWYIVFKDGERIEIAFDEAAREVAGTLFVPGLAPLTARGPGQWEVLQALIRLHNAGGRRVEYRRPGADERSK